MLSLNPKDERAYIGLGNIYYFQSKYESAVAHYKRAIEINPKNAMAYKNLGFAYYGQSKYEDAIDPFKKAIELNSKYSDTYLILGWIYRNLKRYNEAVAVLKKAVEIETYDRHRGAQAYYNLGLSYVGLENKSMAMEQYNKLTVIDRDLAQELLKEVNKIITGPRRKINVGSSFAEYFQCRCG